MRDVRMHLRASNLDANGAPVVLVHGVAVSHRYLMPVAALLAARYPVHVVDLPGFGLSDDPGGVLDVPGLADYLARWLRVGVAGSSRWMVSERYDTRQLTSTAKSQQSLGSGPHMRPPQRRRRQQESSRSKQEHVPSCVELGCRSTVNSKRRHRQFRCPLSSRGGRVGGAR